jgi:hypothetical protein
MTLWLLVAGTALRACGPAPVSIAAHGVSVVASRATNADGPRIYLEVVATGDRVESAHVYVEDPIDFAFRGQRFVVTGTFEAMSFGPQGQRVGWLSVPGPLYAATLYSSFQVTARHESQTYWLVAEPAIEGDLNGDGRVDGIDSALLLGSWDTDDRVADINADGCVDGGDLSIVLGNWTDSP